MALSFLTMTDRHHELHVLGMMRELYGDEGAETNANPDTFPATIDRLLAEPSRGRIVLFMRDDAVCGYGLLIPYWSNEFGGTILFVDELVVEKECRRQGIARAFFAFLERERPFESIVLALEVVPENTRARALYESMGFAERHPRMMTRRLNR
ncbi:MAG TPA: GNAT family N-acetyltransferase [Vicinamibacterales bacterium]|nr:GNAT family N-acetyltransferase [Vicinamibacterales bacterium]